MQLKSFSAKTASQVLSQIRADLGPEAVILETKEEGGLVTMTAALKRPPVPKRFGRAAADIMALNPTQKGDISAEIVQAALPMEWEKEWEVIKKHFLALMKPALKLEELAPSQRVALEFLQKEGVSDEAIISIYNKLKDEPGLSILQPLGEIVRIQPWGTDAWPERLHFIAGPFGVGKTTVTIRLALLARKEKSDCKVCLVNADATRGNGRILLRHYCDLSDMVYQEAGSSLELAKVLMLAKQKGFDKVFIDLPGLSRGSFLDKLLEDVGFGPAAQDPFAVHLVLPPYLGYVHNRSFVKRYAASRRGSLIWAKLDEAEHFGALINIGLATGLPVSALSFGPGLGNSLSVASEAALWRLVFKRELPALATAAQ